MKKQILFLAMFTMALIFAGTNSVFGQAKKWSDPRPFTCTDDALHPIPGKQYTYTAETNDVAGGAWRFWATTDPSFITGPNGAPVFNTGTALATGANSLLTSSLDYNIEIGVSDANENTDGEIELTWSATILNATVYQTTPTFVVAYYVDAAGCTDNIKVWELDPKNGFTVDIIAMDAADFPSSKDAYDPAAAPETCVDVVEAASYSGGAMVFDYGQNYLYFEFVAANFTDSWVPTFDLTGLNAVQSVTSWEFTYALPDTWGTTTPTWTPLVSGTTSITVDPAVTDMTTGVSIFVRVLVDHANYENTAAAGQTLVAVLDGELSNGDWDVQNDDCDLPDPNADDQNDTAGSTITPRPSVTDTTMPTPNLILGNEQN